MEPTSKRYPRARLAKVGSADWQADGGYRVAAVQHFGVAIYAVYVPGGYRPRAMVETLAEARETIAALRATCNECPNAHLVFTG